MESLPIADRDRAPHRLLRDCDGPFAGGDGIFIAATNPQSRGDRPPSLRMGRSHQPAAGVP